MLGHRERGCRVLWTQSHVPASAGTTFGSAPEPPSSLKAMASAIARAAWRCWPQSAAHPLMEKPEDPLSNVDPPASMSRNEVESPWGKCEADTIRGHLATLITRLAGR